MYTIQAKARKNSQKFSKIIAEFETEKEVIDYLKENNIKATGTPYVFTCILLDNNQIIKQSICNIICSPQKLAEKIGLK